VSQCKTDPQRSTEYLPYYPHDARAPLAPGEITEVDLEIWPMGLALEKGSRLTLTIQGKDFEQPGATGPLRGVAWFTHDDPTDRPNFLPAPTRCIRAGRTSPICCCRWWAASSAMSPDGIRRRNPVRYAGGLAKKTARSDKMWR
jgi:hypothetical protein